MHCSSRNINYLVLVKVLVTFTNKQNIYIFKYFSSIAKRDADPAPRKRYYSRGRSHYSSGGSNSNIDLTNLLVVKAAAVGGGLLALGLAGGGLNGISIPAINIGK